MIVGRALYEGRFTVAEGQAALGRSASLERMFWLRVLAIAQLALLARHHLTLLEPDERSRLASLVAQVEGPAAHAT